MKRQIYKYKKAKVWEEKRDEVRDEIWGRDSEGGSVRQPRQPGTQSERRVTVHGVATRSLLQQSTLDDLQFGK